MDDRHQKLAYVILNENYEAEVEKSLQKLRKMSNRTAAQKVFDEISEPVLSSNHNRIASSLEENSLMAEIGETQVGVADIGAVETIEENDIPIVKYQVVNNYENGDIQDDVGAVNNCENEEKKVNQEKSLENLRNLSALKVFDEMSDSVLSRNHGQIPLSEVNQRNNVLILDVDNNNEIQVGGEHTRGYGNEGTQAEGISLSLNGHLVDKVYMFRSETDSDFIGGIQQPNAYKMLDELPLPTFIKEMAEASKATEVESVEDDYELEPAIQKVQGDHFTQKRLCAKLCTLEGSHLRDLVIIYANRMRFSTIPGPLLNGCQLSDKMPHKVDDSYGNSYFECPCFEVSAKSFVMLNADYSSKFIENVASPLLLSDIDWFIGSSISMILDVNVYKSKVFELEHDWRSQSNFKEVNSWDKPSIWNDYGMLEITSGLLYSGSQFMILKSLYILLITCGSISVGFSLINGTQVAMFEHSVDLCPIWISAPYDPGILRRALVVPYTLEDKGNFRGEEDKLFVKYTCQLFSVPVFHHNHISSGINKRDTFLISIFNPSGLSWLCELRGDHSHKFLSLSVLVLAPFVDKVVIFVLNDQGSYTTWLLPFLSLSYSRNVIEFLCLIVTLALEKNGEQKRDGVHNLSSHSEAGTVCFKEYIKSVYFILGLGNVLNHIYVKMWCHVRLGKSSLWSIFFLYSNFNGFLIKNFIWDPGIIGKIAYEQFRTSNVSRVGCRKDIILLTLWLVKYLAASSQISDVGAIGFVNFDYFASSVISNVGALGSDNFKHASTSFKMSEVLLLGTIEHWFISMKTILVKNSPRIRCKFSLFMIISSLVFDPGGLKYDIFLVESLTSKFVQTAAIFLSCCLPQLNLLQSSDCADREVAIVVFDPGGYCNGLKVRERPKACQYGGGKQLKDKRSEDLRIYVFDPG